MASTDYRPDILLAERKALLLEDKAAALINEREVTRAWKGIPNGFLDEARALLLSRRSETGFYADQKQYASKWRIANVSIRRGARDQDGQITETLRYGLATAIDWTEARIFTGATAQSNSQSANSVANTTSDDPENVLTIRFPNLDPQSVKTLLESSPCNQETLTSFTVETQAYTGTWHVLFSSAGRQDDGAAFIDVVLAQPKFTTYAVENYMGSREDDVYRLYMVPKTLVQTILDAWKTAGASTVGYSAREAHNADNRTSTLTLSKRNVTGITDADVITFKNCDRTDTTDYYFGVKQTSAHILNVTNYPNYGAAGYTHSKTERENGDGTYDITITESVKSYRAYDAYTSVNTPLVSATETQQLGLTTQDPTDISTAEAGIRKRQSVTVEDDCSKRVTTTLETATAADDGSDASDNYFETSATAKALNQSSEASDPGFTAGAIVRTTNRKNEFGVFDTAQETRTATARPDATLGKRISYSETVDRDVDRNQVNAASLAVSQTPGEITTVTDGTNEFGRHDIETETRTATQDLNNSEQEKTMSADQTVVRDIDRNKTAAATLPTTFTAGTIQTVKDSVNEFALHDHETTTRTAVAQGPSSDAHGGPLVHETTTIARNASTMPSPGAGASGSIIDVNPQLNEFGYVDYAKTVRTAVPFGPSSDSHGGPLVTETIAVYRNQDSPPSPGAGSAGTIVDVSHSVNEYGKTDYAQTTRTATAVNGTAVTLGGPLVNEQETVYRNQASPIDPNPGSAGTINDVSNNINEFARYDSRKVVRTSVETNGASSTSGGPLVVETETVHRHNAAPVSPGAGLAGTINDVSNNLNEFGRFDARKVVRTAQKPSSVADAHGGPIVNETTTVQRNDTTAPSPGPGAVGTIVDVNHSVNEFGLVDWVQSERTAQKPSAVADSHGGPLVAETVTVQRNDTASASPGAGVAGTIESVSHSVNEFGLVDWVRSTRTAVAAGPITDSHGGPLVHETTTVERNQTSTPSPGAGTAGTLIDVAPSINEFGLVDFVKTVRTAVGSVGNGDDSTETLFESGATAKSINETSQGSGVSFSAGTIQTRTNRINEYGLFDTALETRTAKAVSSQRVETEVADEYTRTVTTNVHQTSDAGTPSQADGTVESRTSEKDEFGRYTTRTDATVYNKQDTGIYSYPTKRGSVTKRSIKHGDTTDLATLLATLSSSTENEVDVTVLTDGTLHISLAKRQKDLSDLGGLYPDALFLVDMYLEGAWQQVKVYESHKTAIAQCATFINTPTALYRVIPGDGRFQTGYEPVVPHTLWRVRRCEIPV